MKKFFNKNKKLSGLLVILVLVIVAGILLPEPKKYDEVNIKLKQIDFKPFKTQFAQSEKQILKKPYMLVEFFTFSCPYCKASIPALNKLNQRNDLSVVGHIMANVKDIKKYAKENNVKYTISRATPYYMDTFKPVAVPMSFILNTKTLKVEAKILGLITESKITDILKSL